MCVGMVFLQSSSLSFSIIPTSQPIGGAKFEVLTVSPVFEGKPLLQRHRAVNTALAKELELIHAITLKCLTPAQWEEKKKTEQQAT